MNNKKYIFDCKIISKKTKFMGSTFDMYYLIRLSDGHAIANDDSEADLRKRISVINDSDSDFQYNIKED